MGVREVMEWEIMGGKGGEGGKWLESLRMC